MSNVDPQFKAYIKKTIDLLGDKKPLDVQKKTAAKLRKAVSGLSRKQLSWNPAPGKWSIRQIIAHLADTEMTYGYRLRRILASSGSVIEAYDQDAWAREERYQDHSVENDIGYFDSLRRMNLEFYKRLPKEGWQRFGLHVERGEESIERICLLLAGHDLNHLGQIEAIRKRLLQK